jgi:hypothetical protein
MQSPSPSVKSDLLEIINRVLILLGLPLVSYSTTSIPVQSDAGMVNYLLQAQTREVLARGWWFNTWERYLVPAGTLVVDTNGFTPLSVRPSPLSDLECPGDHYELYDNNIISYEDAANGNIDIPTLDTYLDVVVAMDLVKCPTSFVDYVVYKTARLFGRSLGLKLGLEDEQQALTALQLDNSRSSRKHNWFKESTISRRY